MTATTTSTIPQRDGRCFVETPAEVDNAVRQDLAADRAWKDGLGRDDLTLAERTRLYETAMESERELIRVMEAAQAPRARMAGYYEVGGRVWVGFDKVDACGLSLVFKYTKPVFAARRR